MLYTAEQGLPHISALYKCFFNPYPLLTLYARNPNCLKRKFCSPINPYKTMSVTGPIIVLEDDADDQEILTDIFHSLQVPNELKFFNNGQKVLDYLRTTTDKPFIIITDMNLPVMNGLELREEIYNDEYLRRKGIPYIFLSTSSSKLYIEKAYELNVQGYFQKEDNYASIQKMIKMIIDYWKFCLHPNSS